MVFVEHLNVQIYRLCPTKALIYPRLALIFVKMLKSMNILILLWNSQRMFSFFTYFKAFACLFSFFPSSVLSSSLLFSFPLSFLPSCFCYCQVGFLFVFNCRRFYSLVLRLSLLMWPTFAWISQLCLLPGHWLPALHLYTTRPGSWVFGVFCFVWFDLVWLGRGGGLVHSFLPDVNHTC